MCELKMNASYSKLLSCVADYEILLLEISAKMPASLRSTHKAWADQPDTHRRAPADGQYKQEGRPSQSVYNASVILGCQ